MSKYVVRSNLTYVRDYAMIALENDGGEDVMNSGIFYEPFVHTHLRMGRYPLKFIRL